MKKSIWITWEDHRRSRELAQAFSAKYICLIHPGERAIRYVVLTFKTILTLAKEKPETVYCQNPSIVLNALLCLTKRSFKYTLISDRHSNFKFHTASSKNIKWRIFHWLSHYTLRNSEITIVTNEYLKDYVNEQGGNGAVLPDKLPSLDKTLRRKLEGSKNLVFVSTFSEDEPIEAVIAAAKLLPSDTHIYITGNYKKYPNLNGLLSKLPPNVSLTGFVSEQEYLTLINSADLLIVITSEEYTLTCGAYEAVSLGKPLVTGNTNTIRDYFSAGAVYSDYDSDALSDSMIFALNNIEKLKIEIAALRIKLDTDWNRKFDKLLDIIKQIG